MRLCRGIATLLFGVILLGGCDSPSGADDPTARTVSFDFSGHRSGTFQVQGPPAEGGPHAGSFVTGEKAGNFGIVIRAFRSTQPPRGDRIILAFPPRVGTHSCNCPDGDCATIIGRFGVDPTSSAFRPGEERYIMDETCTVTVEELTPERARGTFSGSGVIFWRTDGGTREEATLTITNGRFDAELHPE